MKPLINLFLLAISVLLTVASCGDNNNKQKEFKINNPGHVRASGDDHMHQEVFNLKLNFNGQTISINADDVITIPQKMSAEDQDAMDVMNINQSLMEAEKEAQLLDVSFTTSNEPIENGMFIFGLKTEHAKKLILELHDEEGFALVANNQLDLTAGNNYKALNVSSLEDGLYNFRLKDDMGKEINRQISITQQ